MLPWLMPVILDTGVLRTSGRSFLRNIKRDIAAYFSETTVHGFQYVVGAQNIFERLLWIALIFIGFVLSGILIQSALTSWSDTPLQTTIEKVSLPIEDIEFPAITVCDTDNLQMPRRNRWMFLEQLLNWVDAEPEIHESMST